MAVYCDKSVDSQQAACVKASEKRVVNDGPLSTQLCSLKTLKFCNAKVPQYLFALSLCVFLYNVAVFSFHDIPFVSDDNICMLCIHCC